MRTFTIRRNGEPTTSSKGQLRLALLRKYGDGRRAPCAFCGRLLTRKNMTIDHFPIPQRFGGPWTVENLRPACYSCNSTEGAIAGMDLKDFLKHSLKRPGDHRDAVNAGIDRRRAAIGQLTYTIGEVAHVQA